MEKKRPIGVTILAILAVVGAIVAIYYTLQMLHLIPITGPFGQFKFFTFDLLEIRPKSWRSRSICDTLFQTTNLE